MTQPATSTIPAKSPLDAAQKIVAELHGMNQADQLLAIQYASQTFLAACGIDAPGASPSPR